MFTPEQRNSKLGLGFRALSVDPFSLNFAPVGLPIPAVCTEIWSSSYPPNCCSNTQSKVRMSNLEVAKPYSRHKGLRGCKFFSSCVCVWG